MTQQQHISTRQDSTRINHKIRMDETDERLAEEILRELRAVSEKRNHYRFYSDSESSSKAQECDNSQSFIDCKQENPMLNQYWYSKATIDVLCKAIVDKISSLDAGKVAFLSTPSLYFGMPPMFKDRCFVFDIDSSMSYDPNYVFFDFENPEALPANMIGVFDMVVIDPPFITSDVWEKYAITVNRLMQTSNRYILATTITENDQLMYRLFQAKSTIFQPCIPNLVYQYRTYCNFSSSILSAINHELM